jgi:CheY-like chemotaxis protein
MLGRLTGEGVSLEMKLSPDLGCIRADQGQIEQVILNLVVNSRDAMTHGGSITIETANVDFNGDAADGYPASTAGPYVMVRVADTGAGMDEETKKRMFEPFFTTKEKGKGTGLGLATMYAIVKQCGGTLRVESKVGEGTTIKVYLPRVSEQCEAAIGHDEPTGGTEGTETILVAEDESAVRELAGEVLRKCGYTVLAAVDGGDALRIAADHGGVIDLLLTDVVMPGINGQELAKRLTAQRPGLRVLYMSGYTDNVIAHNGILDPGTCFLQKPFTPLLLAEKVREVLSSL